MSEEPLANKSQPPPAQPDAEYDLIYATVSETAQGRRFLEEYARRCRPTDTELTLAAIERMQTVVLTDDGAGRMSLLLEMAEMAQTIARMRAEIIAISPLAGLAAAGEVEELDAIVDVTEAATSRIRAAAEQMQEIAWTLRESGANSALCDLLDAQAMEISTACSFQDLTGQRTRQVIGVLHYLEQRINASVTSHEIGGKAQEPAGFAQADVDAVTQPAARTASDERQDATLEDISRLMLAIEPSVTLYKTREHEAVAEPVEQPDANMAPAPAADVRPELSASEAILTEADTAREMAEWAVEAKALETPKAEAEASAEWVVEHTNAPRPESEPAWMILHRMDSGPDAEAALHGPAFLPAPPIPPVPAVPVTAEPVIPPSMPRAEEPGMFVASSMAQLATTLRPPSLLPAPELIFRSRLPAADPLTDALEAAEIKLPQPADDDGSPIETIPLAAETEADDFLFAPDTDQTHPDADVFVAASQPTADVAAVHAAETAQASPVETEQLPPPKAATLANDPLAPIRALSDAQKIALFS